jgi:hypothetical protein
VDAAAEAVLGFEAAGEELGHRHRLGGRPTWLQDDQTPTCRDCGERMTFYGQLDSIGDDINLANAGPIYVFVCLIDIEGARLLQSG